MLSTSHIGVNACGIVAICISEIWKYMKMKSAYEQQRNACRCYRISTQIYESYGIRMEILQMRIREKTGIKPKICEILETAIEELENKTNHAQEND